jgi:hypothetical protein
MASAIAACSFLEKNASFVSDENLYDSGGSLRRFARLQFDKGIEGATT